MGTGQDNEADTGTTTDDGDRVEDSDEESVGAPSSNPNDESNNDTLGDSDEITIGDSDDDSDGDSEGDNDEDPDDDSIGDSDEDNQEDSDSGKDTPLGCGDGVLAANEACDDGNTEDGDGCSGDCLEVTDGLPNCFDPNDPSCHHRTNRCGDGQVLLPEMCDDKNNEDGDGCSASCKVEIGSVCEGEPSVCTPTVCGDGVIAGGEECDDGKNDGGYNECDVGCVLGEYCGDGIRQETYENCDDGNFEDEDDCPNTCRIIDF